MSIPISSLHGKLEICGLAAFAKQRFAGIDFILIPNKNKTIFAARIVPYGVGLLDHICPLCSSEPALSGAILTRKSLSTFYRVSVLHGFFKGTLCLSRELEAHGKKNNSCFS